MGHNKIDQLFFEHPTKHFHIRGISRILKIPKTTVSYHINQMIKDNLIKKEKRDVFPSFKANETNENYRFYKKHIFIKSLIESNVINFIEELISPKCIILFGSFAKGEYDINSDIDIFVQSKEIKIKLSKYEKKLKHPINILFESDLNKLSPELFNNIINGQKLRGFIKIK